MDYKEIVDRAYKNEISVGVDPAVARKFFTDTTNHWSKEQFSESMFLERLSIKAITFILEPLSLLAVSVVSGFAFGWFAFLIIPAVFVTWFIYGGTASIGGQSILAIGLFTAIVWATGYYLKVNSTFISVFLFLFPLPYLLARLKYKMSTFFLRAIVLRNEKVFTMLHEKGIYLRET